MVLKMPVDSEKNFDAVVIGGPVMSPKTSKTKKYVIVGVITVVIAVLILIGLLVGFYLFTEAFHKIVSDSKQTRENTNQNTNVDLTSNIVEYNVNDNGVNAVYVDDYNMFLSVVKLSKDDDVMCFVVSLNVTQKPDLTKFVNNMNKTTDSNVDHVFVRGKIPIPDISFMNRKSRNLCQGVSTYWAYPACQPANGSQKQKRGVCGTVCNYACKWITGSLKCGNYCWISDIICWIWGK